MTQIPFKGGTAGLVEVTTGRVEVWIETMTLALPNLRAGKARPLAVTTRTPFEALPNVPTVNESGLPGFDALNWYPLMAPAGTPRDLVMKLNTEAIKALNSPDVRDKLMAQGLIPAPMSPEQLGQFIREDYERWARVIKAANVKLD